MQCTGSSSTTPESNDNLEKDASDFTTRCNDPMKDDSTPIINTFELFKDNIC